MRSSVVCWLSLALALAWSGTADEPGASPASAGEPFELEALLARMAATRGVSAEFHERREVSLLVEPLESRGSLYFVPPDRMARFTVEPAPAALLVEGDSLRFRESPGQPEVDLSSSPIARAFVDNFMAVFAGDRARLEKLYRAELRGQVTGWELVLTPKSPTLARFIEVVLLRGDATGMQQMEIRDADGDRTVTDLVSVDHDRSFTTAELETLFREGAPLVSRR